MARHKVILQSVFPYNISARCINREWFEIPMNEVWEIFCEELKRSSENQNLLIHSFVLMSNHFHLIASTPQANISECMQQLMYRSSRRLTRKGNRINETFAGRHYKCILHEPNYFLNAYKYNYRNPVTANVCTRAEDYPFSTLKSIVAGLSSPIPLAEDTTYFSDPEGTLKWLNTAPEKEAYEAARFGFRYQYFKPRRGKGKKMILGPHDIL